MHVENVIIIGSGPAGLTAALYAARANLNPLVLTGEQIGGQVSITNEVENYPGFPEGLTGPELVEKFQKQAERFGARIEFGTVVDVDFSSGPPFTVKTYGNTYHALSIIITVGATPRRLGVPGEEEYIGRGVSYCATCDGFFFRGKDVVVVGGGDSAVEEGLFLTKFANEVKIIHRRDQLRAKAILQDRAMKNEKISFIWDSVVEEVTGEQVVNGVKLRNVKTDEETQLKTDGTFVFIGHYPNSSLFTGKLDMDEQGYLKTDTNRMTSVEGVFAAGEIQDPVWRQVATSVGQGAEASMAAIRWLEAHEDEFHHLIAEAAQS